MFYTFADTPILNYALPGNSTDANLTNVTNVTNMTSACPLGKATKDIYSNKMLCPLIASHSILHQTFNWYGVFLGTVAIAFLLGLKIKPDPNKKLSPIVRFLDCEPAEYTDIHLLAYFVVISLCFIFSFVSKKAALMPGSDKYTCLGYGDWSGHEDLCAPGEQYVLQTHRVLMRNYFCRLG